MAAKALVLGLAAAALSLSGCVADSGDTEGDDASESPSDSELDEDTVSTTEQALSFSGCRVQASASFYDAWTTIGASGKYTCDPSRTITIGACVDRFLAGRWVPVACTGARTVRASSSVGTIRTVHVPVKGTRAGYYRGRVRVEGFKTSISGSLHSTK